MNWRHSQWFATWLALARGLALLMVVAEAQAAPFTWSTNGFVQNAQNIPSSGGTAMMFWQSPSFPQTNYFVFANQYGVASRVPFASIFTPEFVGVNLASSDFEYNGSKAWLSAPKSTNIAIFEYDIGGSPPSSATLSSVRYVGTSNCAPQGMLKAASGGLFVFWGNNNNTTTNQLSGVSYRSSAGTWYDTYPITNTSVCICPGAGTSYTVAQHPADQKIWNFSVHDSSGRINAVVAEDTGIAPVITTWSPLTSAGIGDNGPEGEIPQVRAYPDAANNVIRLTYQRNHYTNWSVDPFLKGAYMNVASVASDGSLSYLNFDNWTERIATFSTWVQSGNPRIAYQPISAAGISTDIYIASYNGSSWSQTLLTTNATPEISWMRDGSGLGYVENTTGERKLFFNQSASTYYIDYAGGSDTNNGTSSGSPWKRCPGMNGFAGSYSHTAGDRFIFKGGVTWPVTCFPMTIINGGSGVGTQDYYGVDTNWFAGGSWTRPLFDFENTHLGGSGVASAGVRIVNSSYITFDNIEMARHAGDLGYGSTTFLTYGSSSYVTMTNSLVRDWYSIAGTGPGSDTGGGWINVGTGGNLEATHCVLHQDNQSNKCGAATKNVYAVNYCEIRNTPNAILAGGTFHHNWIHNIPNPSDSLSHPNALETFSPSTIYANLIHDLASGVAAIFTGADWTGPVVANDLIYNNVVYNCGLQAAVQIDTGGYSTSTVSARIYNNTLVHPTLTIRIVERGTGPYGSIDVRNNLLITSGLPFACCNPGAGYANVTSSIVTNNVVYTASVAAGFGFTSANNYQPTLSFGAYHDTGVDFSALFTTDRLGVTRPPGLWDIGAYEFAGLTPPTTVRIAVQNLRAGVIRTSP